MRGATGERLRVESLRLDAVEDRLEHQRGDERRREAGQRVAERAPNRQPAAARGAPADRRTGRRPRTLRRPAPRSSPAARRRSGCCRSRCRRRSGAAAAWRAAPSRPAAGRAAPPPAATAPAIRLHGRGRAAPGARAGSRSGAAGGERPAAHEEHRVEVGGARAVDVALRVVADVQHAVRPAPRARRPRVEDAGVGLRRAAPRPTSRRRRRAAPAPIRSSASCSETSQFDTTPIARPAARRRAITSAASGYAT